MFLDSSIKNTIIALATPPGIGGIGIIRLSGSLSWKIGFYFFQPYNKKITFANIPEKKMLLGKIIDPKLKEEIDEVFCVFFKSPYSYTTEDVVEIHGHGGPTIIHKILNLFLSHNCRLAQNGEFTLRAFLGGRLNLCQAEAVAELINARSHTEAKLALNMLKGSFANKLKLIYENIVNLISIIEVNIDFPEESELLNTNNLINKLETLILFPLQNILYNYQKYKVFREGAKIIMYGKPNVGKSSLFNAILGWTRSLVSSEAGTTRDYLEETILLGGIVTKIVDTAGIDFNKNKDKMKEIERLSQEKTHLLIKEADLCLIIIDGSQELTDVDKIILEETKNQSRLVIVNKYDLGIAWKTNKLFFNSENFFRVSAKSGYMVKELCKILGDMISQGKTEPSFREIIVSTRQAQRIKIALNAINRAIKCLTPICMIEFVAVELREALIALGEIDGRNVSEEVINAIFNNFCLGK